MTDHVVGPGIREAMSWRGETSLEDEHYVGDRMSICPSAQALYVYSVGANQVARVPFETEIGALKPGIRDLRGMLPAASQYRRRDIETIRYLVIHHSGADVDSTAEEIARYHVGMGWPGIGYHFIVHWDGTIDQTQDVSIESYHVHGHNHDALGICCPGDYRIRALRTWQAASTVSLVEWLLATQLPGRDVLGHRHIAVPGWATECPGRLMEMFG